MSIRCIAMREYTAKRPHKRRCFACGGEIRVGDACVEAKMFYDFMYSTVEHDECSKEACRLLGDYGGDGYPERALTEYWTEEDWSPEYAAWHAARTGKEKT